MVDVAVSASEAVLFVSLTGLHSLSDWLEVQKNPDWVVWGSGSLNTRSGKVPDGGSEVI